VSPPAADTQGATRGRYIRSGTLGFGHFRLLVASLTVWWHTGQLATRTAASIASARQRASNSGQSRSIVVRWLRLVAAP
jgi:hypothetical protein